MHADRLLTTGWYAHCRNPIYVGNLLIILGLLIIFNNAFLSLIVPTAILFSYHAIVITEEAYLSHRFGMEYLSYCRRVRRWWPIFRGMATTARSASFNWRWVIAKTYTSAYSWLLIMVMILLYKAWLFRDFGSMPENRVLAGILLGCSLLFLVARWLKKRTNVLAAGPAAVIPSPDNGLLVPRWPTRQTWLVPSEAGLGASLFVLPTMLALVPRGAAPLVAIAGLCAIGAVEAHSTRRWRELRVPGALLGLLLLWGGLSALWAIDPARTW